jgi:hypothetical protein
MNERKKESDDELYIQCSGSDITPSGMTPCHYNRLVAVERL